MRIALDLRSVQDNPTGIGHYSLHAARALTAMAPANQYLLLQSSNASAQVIGAGHNITHYWTQTGRPPDRLTKDLWESIVLPRLLANWRADIFHSPTGMLPLRRLPVSTVVTLHDATIFEHPELNRWHLRFRMKTLMRRGINRADIVVADSEATKRAIARVPGLHASRVEVSYLGVDEAFNPLRDDAAHSRLIAAGLREPFVLALGLHARKNTIRLISAFERIAEEFPELWLVLAGRPDTGYRSVVDAVQASPISRRIYMPGYVLDDDLPELLRSATVLAYPSIDEGFGLPPLQSMASGTAVLASTAGSIPEVVGDCAVLVNPLSIDEIASGLVELLKSAELRESIVLKGLSRAKRFTWKHHAEDLLRIYKLATTRAA